MKYLLPLLVVTAAIAGCAATYVQPKTIAPTISANVLISKANLLRAAKQVLVANGYQITNSDNFAGVISTAQKNQRVTPKQADCGTTMGINYLKDNRTDTSVAFGIIVGKGKITVKADIDGAYKPGAVEQNITLTCVSKGVLERVMLTQILAQAST